MFRTINFKMKYLVTILLSLICFCSFGQGFTNTTSSGSTSTLQQGLGGYKAKLGLILPDLVADTTTANTMALSAYAGSLIQTTGGVFWIRQLTPNRWNKISTSSSTLGVTSVTGTANQISITPTTGNVVVSLPTNVIISGTFSGSDVNATNAVSAALLQSSSGSNSIVIVGSGVVMQQSGGSLSLVPATLTGSRIATFQNATGTVAYLTDVSGAQVFTQTGSLITPITSGASISTTGNIIGAIISATGNLNVVGNTTAQGTMNVLSNASFGTDGPQYNEFFRIKDTTHIPNGDQVERFGATIVKHFFKEGDTYTSASIGFISRPLHAGGDFSDPLSIVAVEASTGSTPTATGLVKAQTNFLSKFNFLSSTDTITTIYGSYYLNQVGTFPISKQSQIYIENPLMGKQTNYGIENYADSNYFEGRIRSSSFRTIGGNSSQVVRGDGTLGTYGNYITPFSATSLTTVSPYINFSVTGNITAGTLAANSSATVQTTLGVQGISSLNAGAFLGSTGTAIGIPAGNTLNFASTVNGTAWGYINSYGYNDGVLWNTQFRNLVIGNGKLDSIAKFNGSDKLTTLYGGIVAASLPTYSSGGIASIGLNSSTGAFEKFTPTGGTVTGSGTTNTVPKWTSSTALGNSLITDDGTTVVINSNNSFVTTGFATSANITMLSGGSNGSFNMYGLSPSRAIGFTNWGNITNNVLRVGDNAPTTTFIELQGSVSVSGATLTTTGNIQGVTITATGGISGTIATAAQPNITSLGVQAANLKFSGNNYIYSNALSGGNTIDAGIQLNGGSELVNILARDITRATVNSSGFSATGTINFPALSGTGTQLASLNAVGQLVRSTSSAPISGSFSGVGTATTTFTVTIGQTMANSTYKVNVTPTAALSAALFYVTNKTTTTFDVVYLAGLTGTVTFDYSLFP